MDCANDVLPTPGGPRKHRTAPVPRGFRFRAAKYSMTLRFRVVEPRLCGIEHLPGALQVDRRFVAPGPREVLQPLDPGTRLAARIVRQPRPLGLDGRPHGQRQRVGGAVSQERRDEGRGDDVRPPGRRQPAQHDLTTDIGKPRLQALHARFAGVVPNHSPDRLRLETNVAPERRRTPRLARAVSRRRRARRQRPQLVDGRNDSILDHDRSGRRWRGAHRYRRFSRFERQDARRCRQRVVERTLQQVLLRDRQLLLLGVRRQGDDVQEVPHRRGDRLRVGRRRDPQEAGQVERDVEVGVPERRPLRRVQDAEQRIGVPVLVAHLVDTLEDEGRIVHPGLAQALDHTAGGDAAPRPVHLPLGRLPVQGHGDRGSAQGLRNGQRERCLAGPAGAGQAENRRPPLNRSRANDQRGQRIRLRAPARTGTLEGQQVARLGTRSPGTGGCRP